MWVFSEAPSLRPLHQSGEPPKQLRRVARPNSSPTLCFNWILLLYPTTCAPTELNHIGNSRDNLLRLPEFEHDIDEHQEMKEKKRVGSLVFFLTPFLYSSCLSAARLVLRDDQYPLLATTTNANHNSSARTDMTLVDDQLLLLGPTYNANPSLLAHIALSTGASQTNQGPGDDRQIPSRACSKGRLPFCHPSYRRLLHSRPACRRSLTAIKSGSHMMFGFQNNVSECMDNCLDPSHSQSAKNLCYHKLRNSVLHFFMEEQFAYLLVNVAKEGHDLYDGLG
ncbi:ubiquitin carboxyl-terminal hydrolase [Puccinia sorghi]|uniref:Ubiquitin carboxyl-terminal hydrolase n=1 Tax=Puccinia sorghi TaxID=27349 RepID=A0A0L6VL91_9BASI|nr:ubiquitin carboxyl-terminal hydrolase [Puccinia sorghi]